jgi:hypothetical protein
VDAPYLYKTDVGQGYSLKRVAVPFIVIPINKLSD